MYQDEQSDKDLEEFKKAILHRRLLYLWSLKAGGYKVEDEEIRGLEEEVYPNHQKFDSKSESLLSQRDIDELQLQLSIVEPQSSENSSFTKALLFRLHDITLRMRKETNHQRPHFHIEYRNQYSASFAIDNFEKLAGYVPTKYEKPILEWAMNHQNSLRLTWEKLQAGEGIRDLVSAEKEV
jgi:hypothetical protein